MVLPFAAGSGPVREAPERIRQRFAEPLVLGGTSLSIDASFGVALCPHDASDFETLVMRGDVAMYAAKDTGSACVFYRDELESRRTSRAAHVRALRL